MGVSIGAKVLQSIIGNLDVSLLILLVLFYEHIFHRTNHGDLDERLCSLLFFFFGAYLFSKVPNLFSTQLSSCFYDFRHKKNSVL